MEFEVECKYSKNRFHQYPLSEKYSMYFSLYDSTNYSEITTMTSSEAAFGLQSGGENKEALREESYFAMKSSCLLTYIEYNKYIYIYSY